MTALADAAAVVVALNARAIGARMASRCRNRLMRLIAAIAQACEWHGRRNLSLRAQHQGHQRDDGSFEQGTGHGWIGSMPAGNIRR